MNRIPVLIASATLAALSASAATAECFNLSKHFPNGPFAGGTVAIDGWKVELKLEEFYGPPNANPPTPNPGYAEMWDQQCFGDERALWLNNINLRILVDGEPAVETANVNFCNYGGYSNVDVANNRPPKYIGPIMATPSPMEDNNGNVVNVGVRGSNAEGKLTFEQPGGNLTNMMVGGQEFFVSSICLN